MKKSSFVKMTGAGNDFILFDKKVNPDLYLSSEKIKKICDRRYGIGADGVLEIDDSGSSDFLLSYYNSDGSRGSLCGNGARCAIKYASLSGRINNEVSNFTIGNLNYSGMVINEELIKFYMKNPQEVRLNLKIEVMGQLIEASFLDTGSPHAVLNAEHFLKNQNRVSEGFYDIFSFPVFETGKEIRYKQEFAPEGTNVNFFEIIEDQVYIRTYERGVEDETLACGTGAAATAICCHLIYNLTPPISLKTRGGDILIVDFEVRGDEIDNLTLTGPAEVIFNGEIQL